MAEERKERMLTLRILLPDGKDRSVMCDSVTMTAKDGGNGKGGGSVGIRCGHLPALIALDRGNVIAKRNDEKILEYAVRGGIASVDRNIVTVIPE